MQFFAIDSRKRKVCLLQLAKLPVMSLTIQLRKLTTVQDANDLGQHLHVCSWPFGATFRPNYDMSAYRRTAEIDTFNCRWMRSMNHNSVLKSDRRWTTYMDDWRIGKIRVTRILEMCDPLRTPFEWFPDCTEEALKPHLHWLMSKSISPTTGRLILPIQSYLVRTTHHTILVDSCVGNNKTCRYFPHWQDRNDGTFLEQLKNAGVGPEQIDYVLCTHLHMDHCGWNTRLLDGRWVPTFPNARYIIARREFEAAQLAAVDAEDGTYEENVLPIVEAGRAVFVEMDHALDNEVWLEPTSRPYRGARSHKDKVSGNRGSVLWRSHALADAMHISRLECSV